MMVPILIPLWRLDGTIGAHTRVDADDAEFVNRWRWFRSNGYAARRGGTTATIYLHRELLGLTACDGLEADHISRDKLDNRRANLRVATHAQNTQNHPGHTGRTSRFRGVSWDAHNGKWRAQVMLNRRNHQLGRFADEAEAAAVAEAWRAENMPYATAA